MAVPFLGCGSVWLFGTNVMGTIVLRIENLRLYRSKKPTNFGKILLRSGLRSNKRSEYFVYLWLRVWACVLVFPLTPPRSEFVVMAATVCIIHAGGGCNADDQQLSQAGARLPVTRPVCVTDIDSGLVSEYTRDSFLFAVWTVLIALCIARHLIRSRSQPLEMASNGTGRSNKGPGIW